jgi:hypothetical protein
MLAPILGPFGGDQLIVALNAGHPEGGTKIGFYHRRNLNVFDSPRIRKEVTDLWQHITQGLNDLNVGRDDERALVCDGDYGLSRIGRAAQSHAYFNGAGSRSAYLGHAGSANGVSNETQSGCVGCRGLAGWNSCDECCCRRTRRWPHGRSIWRATDW